MTRDELGPTPPSAFRLRTDDPLGPLVSEALRANAGQVAERLAERRAAAEVRQARGLFLPSLGVESRYAEQRGTLDLGEVVNPVYATLNELTGSDRFPTDVELTLPQRHDTRLRLTQPVFDPTIWANHSLARHRHSAQLAGRDESARRLAADVQTAYLDVASARSAVRILESALARAREGERVAQRLVDAGRATPDGLFRARADRSEVAQQLDEAKRTADAAARSLNQLLGRPLETPVQLIADSLLVREIDLTEDEAVASALTRREELSQLDAGAKAADAGVRLATASLLPTLAVALDYGFQGQELGFGADDDYFVATVVARWTPFNGGHDVARRQAAQLEADRVRAQRREVEERIRLDVVGAYDAAVVARAAIATAEERLVAARRTFELVQRRYEEGVASHIELVDARASFTSAELNHSITLYRYAARTVDLERAAALRAID